jgi:hypothetical protein
MTICSYAFEDYVEKVRSFHGFAAPGVIIGGFMVDLAICPRCNEVYPAADGPFCLGCADGNICVPLD